jgi:type II secretory pathway pseudopilin PulG
MMKKAFSIIELLVGMALLTILIAISGIVFSAAVKMHRTAGATAEIATKLRVMKQQLDADFGSGHLQKDGEFLIVSILEPEYATKDGKFVDINTTVNGVITSTNPDGVVPDAVDDDGNGIPDRYLPYDRVMFFTTGDFQSYNAQPADTNGDGTVDSSKIVYSNEARVCYSFGKDASGTPASHEPMPSRRIFCRTQHLITGDTDLPVFPTVSSWNQATAETFNEDNFKYEYQTMTKEGWFAMTDVAKTNDLQAKIDMLFYIAFDTPFSIDMNGDGTSDYSTSSWCTYGTSNLKVDTNNAATLHPLFMQGVGQFHVQKWEPSLNRWYPEIDLDGDGVYNEAVGGTDYVLSGDSININSILGQWYPLFGTFDATIGSALKFTFTLYDSKGVYPEGKTFTYIVYL